MRITVTIDDDITARLNEELRRSGCSLKQLVNEALPAGLDFPRQLHKNTGVEKHGSREFKVRARDFGFRPGLNYDNTGELLEQIEGPLIQERS